MSDHFDQFYMDHSDIEMASQSSETGSQSPADHWGVGQDQPPSSKVQRLCQYWKFRFTGYKVDQKSLQDLLDEIAEAYGFQEEQGKGHGKVVHFQGTFDVGPSRMRWSQLEKKFQSIAIQPLEFPAKDYMEKSDSAASKRYCMKLDTRTNGPWFKGVDYQDLYEEIQAEEEPEYKIVIELRHWQNKIKERILDLPSNERDIWWLWEPFGGLGKTTFQKWIFQNYERVMVLGGKAADMKNGIIEYLEAQRVKDVPFKPKYPKVVILNLPMTFNVDYFSPAGVEEVKDMFFYSGKYKGGMVDGPSPKVIIFANCRPPKIDEMAKDRWRIRKLPDGPGKDAELDDASWEFEEKPDGYMMYRFD